MTTRFLDFIEAVPHNEKEVERAVAVPFQLMLTTASIFPPVNVPQYKSRTELPDQCLQPRHPHVSVTALPTSSSLFGTQTGKTTCYAKYVWHSSTIVLRILAGIWHNMTHPELGTSWLLNAWCSQFSSHIAGRLNI